MKINFWVIFKKNYNLQNNLRITEPSNYDKCR